MDYSQFLALKQEIGLLVVFLLVFLYDTFAPRKSQASLPVISTLLMLVFTVWGFCPLVKADAVAFAGMYVTDPVMVAIKNILNVGVVIVLIQSIKWANSEFTSVRRGEFYELILLTLLGMYFMISSRHFLMFIIGLETPRSHSAPSSLSTRIAMRAMRQPSNMCSPPCSRQPFF